MVSSAPAPFEAFFLAIDGDAANRRFCLFHPAQGPAARGAILYVHPFAEEMNKSRRMAAMQARALAQAGYAVLQIDLLGCGDSSGDFGDAGWQDWVDDVLRGAAWLREHVRAPLWLWGLRVGCLLAADAARHMAQPPQFLFWAPSISGKQSLQQFLRLKAAADIASGNAKAVIDGIRAELALGRRVEIAGYVLGKELAQGLEQAALDPPAGAPAPGTRRRLEWLELSTRSDASLSPVGVKALQAWRERGDTDAHATLVQGPAFWQTTEIEDAPHLVEATLAALAQRAIT